MTDREFYLHQKAKRREIGRTIMRGIKSLKDKRRAVCFVILTLAITIIALRSGTTSPSVFLNLRDILTPGYVIVGCSILTLVLYLWGQIPHAREIHDNLESVGVVNYLGDAPYVTSIEKLDNRLIRIAFDSQGVRAAAWMEMQPNVESALGLIVLRAEDGKNMREVSILGVKPIRALPEEIHWNPALISNDCYTIVLGESQAGLVTMNLQKTPHWLIAATTGMGKTQLAILIVEQCLAKGMKVAIADWKGGVDYSRKIQTCCNFITDYETLLAALDAYIRKIKTRKQLYALEVQRQGNEEITCNNIEIYNKLSGTPLSHYVFLMDEASMIFDATGRSKEDKALIAAIIEKINEIGRIGRAYGIHLIISTQRPDVASVPGTVKANLDGRICGHMADDTSSMVIMDNGNAAKLPNIPGRFLMRDGSGSEIPFQVYLP